MSGSPLSGSWYRVADLKPRLRPHARLYRHRYRGEVWFLLQDAASGRTHRFTPAARQVFALLDGERSVEKVWQAAGVQLGEAAPTQDELIQLLGQLHAADLLQTDVSPDVAEVFGRRERERAAKRRSSFGNPMAMRMPLWDPDRFLEATAGLWRLFWGPAGALLWLAVLVPAVLLLPSQWPALANNFTDRALAVDNLVALYLLFPLLKLMHEMGHATATKAGGGEVHDMGMMLLVMLPVPYVDASASSAFPSKWRRAQVGAAGMMVELFLAALAFYGWMLAEPGPFRAVLFDVMLTAGVSTLVFNGNPLLRYDAYYILADMLEMPNLATRAMRYWAYLLERYLLGLPDATTPERDSTEKTWLVLYGAGSTIYRMAVTVLIALFIASRFFFIGIAMAVWALVTMLGLPLVRLGGYLANSPRLGRRRPRAIAITLSLAATVVGLLMGVSVPAHTQAEGVTWLDEGAIVRAGTSGFLGHFLAEPGSQVMVGDPLLVSYDPALAAQVRLAEARLREAQATYGAELVAGRAEAQIARERLLQSRAELATLRERTEGLTARARAEGTFVVPQAADMPERYFRKGEVVGYVIGPARPIVRVVVPQEAVARVRSADPQVELRVVDRPLEPLTGRVVREVPAGDEYLPSRALAVEGGGSIATDPRDTRGARSLQRMFQFDVALDQAPDQHQFGVRTLVRFAHRDEPLGVQWLRGVRLIFLSHFGV